MVLGIGFLWGFATLPHAIPIYGTLWALLLAYMALGTPVAVRVASGAYQQIATDIEECSRVTAPAGADPVPHPGGRWPGPPSRSAGC